MTAQTSPHPANLEQQQELQQQQQAAAEAAAALTCPRPGATAGSSGMTRLQVVQTPHHRAGAVMAPQGGVMLRHPDARRQQQQQRVEVAGSRRCA
jgi:hypothetical protein